MRFRAGIGVGLVEFGFAPLDEAAQGAGKGRGTGIGGFLIIPVILDDAKIAVTGPDHRHYQYLLGARLVTKILKLAGPLKDIFGHIGITVDVEQQLPVRRDLQLGHEVEATDLAELTIGVAAAEKDRVAGGVVFQIKLKLAAHP